MSRVFQCAIVIICFVISGCTSNKKQHDNPELNHLLSMMTGEFNSSKQSQNDDDYYNISLKMVQIWPENPSGKWLYVEQAVANMIDKPYRQRVYHVISVSGDSFSSKVYELPDPSLFIGGYDNPGLLKNLTPAELILREGCAVTLKLTTQNEFVGSTDKDRCLSQLRGAQYATSKVRISKASISSWDQGFDVNQQQVWGAVKGPYIFDRQ